MNNGDSFIPDGAVPMDASTGEPQEGYTQPEEKATEAETTAEAATEETTAEVNTDTNPEVTTETTQEKTPETLETPTATEDNTSTESTPREESSLHNEDDYSVFHLMEEYNSNVGEGEATFEEMIEIATRDIDKLDPMDIIEEGMLAATNGDITDTELDVELEKYDPLFLSDAEKQQLIEDEEMTENDFRILQAQFDRAVRENKAILEKEKSSVDLKSLLIKRPVQQPASEEKKETSEADMKAVRDSFEKTLENYNHETLKVVDGKGEEIMSVDYALDQEAKTQALDLLANPQGLFKLWAKEDGSFDTDKYISDAMFLLNKSGMLKTIHDQAQAARTEEMVTERDNITDTQRKPSGEGNKILSMHDAARHNAGLE